MPHPNLTVVAPRKGVVSSVEVVFDKTTREGGWSVARLTTDGGKAVGIRWKSGLLPEDNTAQNTNEEEGWFVMPEEIAESVLQIAQRLLQHDDEALRLGYEAMAADKQREDEAMGWSEALIGDGFEAR